MGALAGLLAGLAALAAAGADRLDGHVDIRPPGGAEGPVPAVLLFSGCGGVRPMFDDYADAANQAGWAAVIVDSHAARGIGRLGARLGVCTGLRMRGQDRAEDVFEALEAVRADARLDASALALAGWSHGGWTILDAMAEAQADARAEQPFEGVKAALLVYPYCGAIIEADTAPIGDPFPVTMVLAGKDRIADPDDCRRLAGRRTAEGSRIEIVFEPGLTHAFDDAEQPWDPRMEYDSDGTERSLERFQALLRGVESQEPARAR
ncbi:MAG: dienelactone hydrolase family protein [Oceanicaulis sp.]